MTELFIGSTVRSGGSLLARLFDHHPDVASYPFELHLPMDPALHPTLAKRGERNHVQSHPTIDASMSGEEVVRAMLLDPEPARCLVGRHFQGGKLRAKSRDMDVDAAFDHTRFHDAVLRDAAGSPDAGAAYRALHRALFDAWDDGAHGGTMRYIAYHRANGLLADIGRFLTEFEDPWLLIPIRPIEACLASEKRKVVSQLVSGGVGKGRLQVPDRWLHRFHGRFVENTIVNWLITFTRAVILRELHGDRVLPIHFESLVGDPATTMRAICDRVGLGYDDALAVPTNAGRPWAGNSMFGRKEGVDAGVLRPSTRTSKLERILLEEHAGGPSSFLSRQAGPFLDLDAVDRCTLFDYEHQRRFAEDRDKTALYFASMYERWRYRPALGQLGSRKAKRFFL